MLAFILELRSHQRTEGYDALGGTQFEGFTAGQKSYGKERKGTFI